MKMQAIGFDVRAEVITNRVRVDLDRVRRRAVSTLERRIQVEARRDIQREYNLKSARVRAALSVRHIDTGIVLRGLSRGINAIQFGATWRRRWPGAKYRVRKTAVRGARDGSFIATGKNGNRLVFERAVGAKRLPIQSVYGPSVAQMLKHGKRPERLADFASKIVAQELARLTR